MSDKYPDMYIETGLALHVPLPVYFFVTPTKPKLAERIELGLRQIRWFAEAVRQSERLHAAVQSIFPHRNKVVAHVAGAPRKTVVRLSEEHRYWPHSSPVHRDQYDQAGQARYDNWWDGTAHHIP